MIGDTVWFSHVYFRAATIPVHYLQTLVSVNMYIMSRNPDYVKEPLVFKPERWSRDGSTPKLDPFISIPFGFGPRSCYGRRGNNIYTSSQRWCDGNVLYIPCWY